MEIISFSYCRYDNDGRKRLYRLDAIVAFECGDNAIQEDARTLYIGTKEVNKLMSLKRKESRFRLVEKLFSNCRDNW